MDFETGSSHEWSELMRGVFFDLGGTLFSYRNVARVTMPLLREAAERLGVNTDRERIKAAYNRATQDMTRTYAERAYYLHRDFFLDTLTRYAELLDGHMTAAVAHWYDTAHRCAILDCLVLKEDCRETLEHLKSRGLYLAVVSNIDDDMLEPLIAREGLARFFDHWTSSERAQSCKPDRAFFEFALARSRLAAHEVLFVGDSPEHDIEGAHAVGMRTALVGDGGMPPPLQSGRATVAPHHVLGALADLKALFAD
jgi:putative hydrolase of the HAD superfamily